MGIVQWGARQGRKLVDRWDPPPPAVQPTQFVPARIEHRTAADSKYVTLGAQTQAEAEALYIRTKEHDPFPDVPPALLNSAHIEDYMLETAMVFPYQRERRKTASYAMRIGNRLAYFDPRHPDQGTYHELSPFESFTLPPNSLVYFQTKELFQLPNYMAVRFNLHIELVHKGLLLGTGPLVDPGFSGRLLIPLHNMTNNTYVLAEDDEVIWVEFTKTSPHPSWVSPARRLRFRGAPRAGFAKFPSPKTHLGISDYFARARKAHESRPDASAYPFPANAIPGAVEDARSMASDAEREANRAAGVATKIRNFGIGAAMVAAIGVLLPVFGLVVSALGMVQTTTTMAQTDTPGIRSLNERLSRIQRMAAARDIADARLTMREYCAAKADPRSGPALRDIAIARVRLAQNVANGSANAIGAGVPYANLATVGSPPSCR